MEISQTKIFVKKSLENGVVSYIMTFPPEINFLRAVTPIRKIKELITNETSVSFLEF